MSFIQLTIRCKQCGNENNIALGTFGYGTPENCYKCGKESNGDTDPWYEVINGGWNAKEAEK